MLSKCNVDSRKTRDHSHSELLMYVRTRNKKPSSTFSKALIKVLRFSQEANYQFLGSKSVYNAVKFENQYE